jgi:hypothetical protein
MKTLRYLQLVFENKRRFESSASTLLSLKTRTNISIIIHRLFHLDSEEQCTPSVLTGLLSLYTGSIGLADLLIFDIISHIDKDSIFNIVSSPEIWNAFKNNWSRRYVETVSSTPESPFAIIDADVTRKNVFLFRTPARKHDSIQAWLFGDVEPDLNQLQIEYETYDANFWLSMIAYCLTKVTHSSELTQLVESSAIGYAFVSLSSKKPEIQKPAARILLEWERLCEVKTWFLVLTLGI